MIKYILPVIVVFVVFFIAKGRSTMANGRKQYLIGFDFLADKAHSDLPDCAHEDLLTEKFMSDSGRCYLLIKDKVANVLAVVSAQETVRIKYSSKRSCELRITEAGKRQFSGIICRIEAEGLDGYCDVILGEGKHFKGSFIGKAVINNAKLFKNSFENQ